MARYTTNPPFIDPETGLQISRSVLRVTQDGSIRVTQTTGAPAGSLNQLPGVQPGPPGAADPGVPRKFTTIPDTGPLT